MLKVIFKSVLHNIVLLYGMHNFEIQEDDLGRQQLIKDFKELVARIEDVSNVKK